MGEEKYNLFIYGSLRDNRIFQSVCGLSYTKKKNRVDDKTLLADAAMLSGYRKISPDNVYFYAVVAPSSNIEGLVIFDVPAEAMAEIDRYKSCNFCVLSVHFYNSPDNSRVSVVAFV